MNRLNLGCGADIKEGWINLDGTAYPGVQVVHNLEVLPLPFDDDFFDEILCQDVLEHIEYVPLMKELYRILKPGACVYIRVPHFTSKNNFIDPTHKKRFSCQTFNFFVGPSYFDYSFSAVTKRKISFSKGLLFYNYVMELFVNLGVVCMKAYESTALCRLFPAENILIILKK